MLCQKNTLTHWNYLPFTAKSHFICKMIDCMHQTGYGERQPAVCYTHSGFTTSVMALVTIQSWSPSGANVYPDLIHDSSDPPSPHPKRHLDRFSCFCRVHERDRQTDHATASVTIGHIYVGSTAMRPKNGVVLCQARTESQQTVLLGYAAISSNDSCYQTHWWQFCLSMGQHTVYTFSNSSTAAERTCGPLAAHSWTPIITKFRKPHSSHIRVMSQQTTWVSE